MEEPERAVTLYATALRVRLLVLAPRHPEIRALRTSLRKAKQRAARGRVARAAAAVQRVGAGVLAGSVKGVQAGAAKIKAGAAKLKLSFKKKNGTQRVPSHDDEMLEDEDDEEGQLSAATGPGAGESARSPRRAQAAPATSRNDSIGVDDDADESGDERDALQ